MNTVHLVNQVICTYKTFMRALTKVFSVSSRTLGKTRLKNIYSNPWIHRKNNWKQSCLEIIYHRNLNNILINRNSLQSICFADKFKTTSRILRILAADLNTRNITKYIHNESLLKNKRKCSLPGIINSIKEFYVGLSEYYIIHSTKKKFLWETPYYREFYIFQQYKNKRKSQNWIPAEINQCRYMNFFSYQDFLP